MNETDRPSDRFLQALADCSHVLIVSHDNPDPDAIASGWAVSKLVECRLHKPVRFIAGGEIVRAENRCMVKLLQPPLDLVEQFEPRKGTGAVLVDCGLAASNHLLGGEKVNVRAVIDHHEIFNSRPPLPFEDIRPEVAASASIAASYLREQQVEPSATLATALVYALRTETSGSETHHSPLDRELLAWLTDRFNPTLLAEIQNAPLSRNYFSDLVLALQNTFIYDDAGFCLLPQAQGPEIVGEVADLLVRCEGVKRVFCGAAYRGNLLVSVRTQRQHGNAAELVQVTLRGLGHGGGHTRRAGGKVSGGSGGLRLTDDFQRELRHRWLSACNIDRQRGSRLIAKSAIVGHLG